MRLNPFLCDARPNLQAWADKKMQDKVEMRYNETKKSTDSGQLAKLIAMGFSDLEKCKQTLAETNGDVTAAIEHLVITVVGVGAEGLCRLTLVND